MTEDDWFSRCLEEAKVMSPVPQQVIDIFDGKLQSQLRDGELTSKNITQVANQLIKAASQPPAEKAETPNEN